MAKQPHRRTHAMDVEPNGAAEGSIKIAALKPRLLNFHRFKELYDKGGELALQEIARRKPILKNVWRRRSRTPCSRLSLTKPARGKVRVANELLKRGMSVSPFRRPLHLEPARSHDNETSGKPVGSGARHLIASTTIG
jgi:hypothetical protein